MKLISALLALVVCAAAASDDHHKLHQQKQLRGIAKSYGDTTDPANLADDVVDKAKAGAIRHLVSSDEEEVRTNIISRFCRAFSLSARFWPVRDA